MGAQSPCRPLRVLVVEDDRDTADSLAPLLRLWGHEAFVSYGAAAALEAAGAFQPDAALLDIGLPGMDGYEVARRLRALPGLGPALLVALTGYGGRRTSAARRRPALTTT